MFKEMARIVSMAREMDDMEVVRCMDTLIDGSVVTGITRDTRDNSLKVCFKMRGDREANVYEIDLRLDSVVASNSEVRKLFQYDGEYLYRQYLMAHYYSELWTNNFFVEWYCKKGDESCKYRENSAYCTVKECIRSGEQSTMTIYVSYLKIRVNCMASGGINAPLTQYLRYGL